MRQRVKAPSGGAVCCRGKWNVKRTTAPSVPPRGALAAAAEGNTVAELSAADASISGGGGLRAVVLGAGPTGLAAAHALRSYFDEVVLVEREALDETALEGLSGHEASQRAQRRGVSQYRMPHGLLVGGLKAASEIFGGDFAAKHQAAGAVPINYVADMKTHWGGVAANHQRIPGTEEVNGLTSTRSLLELVIRREALADRGGSDGRAPLTFVKHYVKGLLFEDGNRTVTGVRLTDGTELRSDLLVDATGPSTIVPKALEEAGLGAVPVERVLSDTTYCGCIMEAPPGYQHTQAVTYVEAESPTHPYMGFFWQIEGGMYQVALGGPKSDPPPGDAEGMVTYARKLRSPAISERLQGMRPAAPVQRRQAIQNVWRHFEKVEMPEGLVVAGDASCEFNPIFGQGITVGLLGAAALKGAVAGRLGAVPRGDKKARRAALAGLSQDFQKQLSGILVFPWAMSTTNDLTTKRPEEVQATPPSFFEKLNTAYFYQLRSVSMTNTPIRLRMTRVMHLIAPPTELYHPSLLAGAFVYWIKSLFRGGNLQPAEPTTATQRLSATGQASDTL